MTDIDSLLDQTLDDIADLPEFKPYPAGAHKAYVSFNTKEVNKHPCIEIECKLIATEELTDPTQDPATLPQPGATANVLCMMDNEFGAGNFKALAKPIGAALGTGNLREIVDQTKNLECLIITTLKTDKNDPSIKRMNIKELHVI